MMFYGIVLGMLAVCRSYNQYELLVCLGRVYQDTRIMLPNLKKMENKTLMFSLNVF